jgi:hypothetical protein
MVGMQRLLILALCLGVPLVPGLAVAKPIAYADGTTAAFDYGPHMEEAQVFYAPDFRSSIGVGYVRVLLDENGAGHSHSHGAGSTYGSSVDIGYFRANVLASRWNFTDAQANVYLWGGLGTANSGARSGPETVPNAGFQLDAESRRFYGSLKSDWHSTFGFTYGMNTLQLGVAPYLHDYNGLATWIVLQGHNMSGTLHRENGAAALLRLFWRGIWVEGGADLKGKPLALLMFNL